MVNNLPKSKYKPNPGSRTVLDMFFLLHAWIGRGCFVYSAQGSWPTAVLAFCASSAVPCWSFCIVDIRAPSTFTSRAPCSDVGGAICRTSTVYIWNHEKFSDIIRWWRKNRTDHSLSQHASITSHDKWITSECYILLFVHLSFSACLTLCFFFPLPLLHMFI